MKLAITLIIIGGVLIADGGTRIGIGLVQNNTIAVFSGVLTGLALGGYLLYRGIKRLLRTRTTVRSIFSR